MNNKHFHQYERMEWPNGRGYYKCMIAGCAHYLPIADLVIARESLCWGGCNRLVVITKDDVGNNIKKPMCEFCRKERQERRKAMSEI
jgi:hypothetical protein